MFYTADQHKYVFDLREKNWPDHLIQKYLNYRQKREGQIRRGVVGTGYQDSFRSKTYKAEWEFERILRVAGIKNHKFKDIVEAQKFASKVVKSVAWKKVKNKTGSYNDVSVQYLKRSGKLAGRAWANRIELDMKCGMNVYTLLHELGHVAGYRDHDVGFRNAVIKLTSRFMGREAGKLLKATFKKHGLRVTQKKSVQTPEQWLAGVERMKAARAKKG